MESHIADAMTGNYALSIDELANVIRKQKEKETAQLKVIKEIELNLKNMNVTTNEWNEIQEKLPTWKEVFLNADVATKRVLINKIIERVDVSKEQISVRFKINLDEFQPRMNSDFPTIQYKHDLK